MTLSTRNLTLALLGFLLLTFCPLPLTAAPAPDSETFLLGSQEVAVARVADEKTRRGRLYQKIFQSLKGCLERLTERLTRAERVDLELVSMTMDQRHRVFIDLDGVVELNFDKPHPRIDAKLEEMLGSKVQTNGPLNLDFLITVVEKRSDREYHVEFQANLIIIMEEFLTKLVRFGSSVAGTVTLMGIGNDLASFFSGIDTAILAQSLSSGMRKMTKVVISVAGVESYEAYRGFRNDRVRSKLQNLQSSGQTGTVLAHLARSLLRGVTGVAFNVAGMGLGAAIGAALVPSGGAAVGALLGAAGLVAVGNVAFTKVTVDLPMKYRLVRIRRLHRKLGEATSVKRQERLAEKIEKFETKIVKRIKHGMRTDKFKFLDEFVQQVRRYEPSERQAFASLVKKLSDLLRFEVLTAQDGLAERKLAQLKAAVSLE